MNYSGAGFSELTHREGGTVAILETVLKKSSEQFCGMLEIRN